MAGRHFFQRRDGLGADVHGVFAARREAAAGRRIEQARHDAGNGFQPGLADRRLIDAGDRADEASDKAEIRRLQKELRRAQQERDILKKAVAFFARESEDR